MPNPNEWTELINSIKNLLALNPILSRAIIIYIVWYLIYKYLIYHHDKKYPDLPYQHAKQIYDRLEKIEKAIKTIYKNK